MFIIMHCGGMSFNGDTIKTKSLGGSETAAYYVAKELAALGHRVTLFTNSQESGIFDGVKYEHAGQATEEVPLGDRFTFYAENTPHDICIIQRHPRAFERKWASKQNFWWLHDLALYRTKDIVIGQMWNVDKVLCVSEYHKAQVAKVYDIPTDIIAVMHNGVDLALYDCAPMKLRDKVVSTTRELAEDTVVTLPNTRHFFYSSRPERGLINLVKPGGIMEQLAEENVHLHVCGYDNTTPQMEELYTYLWKRCAELPNVTNHGALTKQDLAALQKGCDAWVYPTEFEEVSCITAMEAMAAGCHIIASHHAAIPETCAEAVAALIPLVNGVVDCTSFVSSLRNGAHIHGREVRRSPAIADEQREAVEQFSWHEAAHTILNVAAHNFATAQPVSLMHHFLRHSDIKAFEHVKMKPNVSALLTEMLVEYEQAYGFYRDNTYAEHYAAYYEYEKNRGVNYGPEDVTGTTRFQHISNLVSVLPAGARVLDYGCAHGHYTVALARRFPQLTFTGADLAQSNVEKARKWAADERLTNIEFLQVGGAADLWAACEKEFDFIIAAEVIEHVGNPQWYVDELASNLTPTGQMVITVPYGPWEAQGYREHGYWRAHLHHFERADLQEMLGHHPNYKIVAAPAGQSQFHSALGSYIVSFDKPAEPSGPINYVRKTMQTMPDQTVTCCMIVKDAEADILRCLNSVAPHVQEFIVGVDTSSTDGTRDILADYATKHPLIAIKLIDLPKVVDTGFAEARNTTLAYASCDWILWIDADEVLTNGQSMGRMLRNSMYNGFAVKQHHFSANPAKVIKVDLPCRLFRNHKGVQFFGAVHEHPEIKLNEGLGPVSLMTGMEIVHHGYVDEGVRRKRFGRNLPLLARDRKELPERLLGKFLWLRDLAQTCQYEIEAGQLNDEAVPARVEEGIQLWLELLEAKNYRLVLDALPYYSTLVMLRGGGVDFSFVVNASWMGAAKLEGVPQVEGYFAEKAHALALLNALAADRLPDIERRYM